MINQIRREYLLIRIMENSSMMPNGCREWTATKQKTGYGMIGVTFEFKGKRLVIPASRAHYMAHHNVILERNQFVCHKCDNPCCVNIEHLFLGSAKDNALDMLAKGRNAKRHRLHTRQRKFTDEQIKAISIAKGRLRDVANLFGCSHGYVSKLRRGKAKTLLCKIEQVPPFVEVLSIADMKAQGWQS
jgi:hypothetical protein